jgi:starch phosphorylase
MKVEATVQLGQLTPSDVAVELYHGPTAGGHELPRGEIVRMHPAGNGGAPGVYRFTGEIPARDSGAHAFAARVMPWNAAMSHPYETSLIRWM